MIPLHARLVAAKLVWGIAAGLVVVLLLGVLSWLLISASNDARHRSDQIDAQSRQIDSLIKATNDREREASAERSVAANNQRALLDYTQSLADRQAAILAYLRVHGIDLPTRLVRAIQPPKIAAPATKNQRAHRPSKRATAPADRRPGKSGHAPGHNKRKGKR